MHLLVVTALLWQTSGKTISHKSRFPPQLIEKEDLTKALHLHPCWQEGRESKILPKHEHTLTDAGYLYFTKANKNKLLFKHSTGNEIGFTSCEQSVSVKAISGGGKKKSQAGLYTNAIFGFLLRLCARGAFSADSDTQSHQLILCRP